jgi:hypothetical protein
LLRERNEKYGKNSISYTRGAIVASVLRDTDTFSFDVISAEIGSKMSRLSQNRMDRKLWVELIVDVANAAQIAIDGGMINPSLSMEQFKNDVTQELEAQMIAQNIKALHENG